MRVLAIGIVSIAVSLLLVLGVAAFRDGVWPTGADAMGFGVASGVVGALLVTGFYWPVLASLRRRGVTLGPRNSAIVAAIGLNAPVYAGLAVVGRDRSLFAGGEAVQLAVGFASMATLFGAGYALVRRVT